MLSPDTAAAAVADTARVWFNAKVGFKVRRGTG
jgi:hypothetical protein